MATKEQNDFQQDTNEDDTPEQTHENWYDGAGADPGEKKDPPQKWEQGDQVAITEIVNGEQREKVLYVERAAFNNVRRKWEYNLSEVKRQTQGETIVCYKNGNKGYEFVETRLRHP